jgi:hypothetical protein
MDTLFASAEARGKAGADHLEEHRGTVVRPQHNGARQDEADGCRGKRNRPAARRNSIRQ